jgi:hypothetical protein
MPPITEPGTATARPGKIKFGYLELLGLPTGITGRVPVILAYGRGDDLALSEQDGWIIGLRGQVTVYQPCSLATMAVRDDEPLVARWPGEHKDVFA